MGQELVRSIQAKCLVISDKQDQLDRAIQLRAILQEDFVWVLLFVDIEDGLPDGMLQV